MRLGKAGFSLLNCFLSAEASLSEQMAISRAPIRERCANSNWKERTMHLHETSDYAIVADIIDCGPFELAVKLCV
jgi:hypothetical protein